MGLVRKTLLFILAVIVTIPGPAAAARNEFDIDLKELRSAGSSGKQQPSQTGKQPRRKRNNRSEASPDGSGTAESNRINIVSAPPCKLARDMVTKMGLLVSPSATIRGVETFSAASAGLNVTVACELSKAELYTYERLLARSGSQLLLFEGGESGERVVEKLANYLGLLFRKLDPNSDTLPLTYVFAPFGTRTQELLLTIQPPPAPQSR